MLLNQNEVDIRCTMKEIVQGFPATRGHRAFLREDSEGRKSLGSLHHTNSVESLNQCKLQTPGNKVNVTKYISAKKMQIGSIQTTTTKMRFDSKLTEFEDNESLD